MAKEIQKVKAVFIILLWAVCFTTDVWSQAPMGHRITIYNPSPSPLVEKVVEVPWKQVQEKWPLIDTASLAIYTASGKQIPFQFETRGEAKIYQLLVQVSVPAGRKETLYLKTGKKRTFLSKTYCRFVPERFDDFAWENDKIAYRMYGKALEATAFNAYGIDVWTKRTTSLVIDKWYRLNDYHTDKGEGCDFYGVGFTLGAGNMAPFLKDSIWHSGNFIRYQVLDNGPLRSSFRLFYDSWKADGLTVAASKTIQLDAGEQLNKIQVSYEFKNATAMPAVIGINEKVGSSMKMLNERRGVLAYWLPEDSVNGTIGVACVFIDSLVRMQNTKRHLLGIVQVRSGVSYTYFAGAAWDRAGEMVNEKVWLAYLDRFAEQIKHKPVIQLAD